jgi:hypothetical protein
MTYKRAFFILLFLLTSYASYGIISLVTEPSEDINVEYKIQWTSLVYHPDYSDMDNPKEVKIKCSGIFCKSSYKFYNKPRKKKKHV